MAIIKLLVITAVLALGTSGVFYVFQNYHLPKSETAEIISENNNPVSNQPLVEQLAPKSFEDSFADSLLIKTSEIGGLINEVSKNLSQSLIENNPDGPVDVGGKLGINAPNPAALAAGLFEETAKKIGLDQLDLIINDADLNILNSADEKDLKKYILSVQKIFNEGTQKQSAISVDDNSDLLNPLIASYQETADKLYQTAVPQPVAEFHKKLLTILLAKKKALVAIQLYPDDAVAIILAGRVSNQADQNLASFFKEFSDFFQKNGITAF